MGSQGLKKSITYAWAGITYVITSENNMKIHVLAALMAVAMGWWLGIRRMEWGLLVVTILLVFITETVNTAIEKTIDMITSNYHPAAAIVKNVAAGAVLLSALNAVIMAFIIFGPYLLEKYLT
ncbi:MAG: diacylglycerol kinase family protein [Syntrophomonadaceae bacterium]|jgi:diacylglycerol kinase